MENDTYVFLVKKVVNLISFSLMIYLKTDPLVYCTDLCDLQGVLRLSDGIYRFYGHVLDEFIITVDMDISAVGIFQICYGFAIFTFIAVNVMLFSILKCGTKRSICLCSRFKVQARFV